MDVRRLRYPAGPEQVLELVELPPADRADLRLGTVRMEAGSWVPSEGYSMHDRDEISIILRGTLEVEIGGAVRRLSSGDISIIPAGERHRARASEATELIWLWFGAGPAEGDSPDARTAH
jgi:quercetin dioxygenase-like cupin family protein